MARSFLVWFVSLKSRSDSDQIHDVSNFFSFLKVYVTRDADDVTEKEDVAKLNWAVMKMAERNNLTVFTLSG